jgi:excisionase family DNA binding protein
MSRLYTVIEVASIIHVKPLTIYCWVKNGKLTHIRVGRLIRISADQLELFLRSGAADATVKSVCGIAEEGE